MIRAILADAAYLIGPNRRSYVLALAWTAGIASSLTLLNPLTTRWIFDVAVPERRFGLLVGVATAATITFSGIRWLDYQSQLYQQRLTNRMVSGLTQRLMEAYYRLPVNTVATQDQGYYVARTMTEVQDTAGPVMGIGAGLLRSAATLVTALGTVLLLSWQLTLVLLVVTPLLLLLSRYFARRLGGDAREVQEQTARQQAVHTHAVGAYRAVRTFSLERRAVTHLMDAVGQRLNALYTLSKTTGLYGTLSRMSLGLTEFTVLTAGGYAVMTTSLTLGSLMAYMGAYWLAVNAVQNLIDLIPQVGVLQAQTERLREITATPPRQELRFSTELTWNNVSCGLGSVPALQDVSLDIPAGARVLVRGANGAGKSTLMLTALGLLEPRTGTVSRPALTSGLIEPFVFPALTLADLLGEDARAEPLIAELGMTELMNRRFTDLSLGQRKKFVLVMTVLREADLYVFDEPLANLDDQAQETVFRLLLERTVGRTLLVVLHGADQFLDHFDHVLEVEGGTARLHTHTPGSSALPLGIRSAILTPPVSATPAG
ncbi:ABC transporter transmembrane domain-containing protein [Deinococcus sp. RM]|uniref:ABC transporter transmembrane domain-containing protein n=1 Tax=Deinococcus sp. RM TaxID=2316359 RepID=UPI000E6A2BAD|nr:ABC transporter ATP-binding protein [Deinococcus sp. RM]RIY15493.1 ABC transporter ATP-binding protein [Deinococcus sp. RM]